MSAQGEFQGVNAEHPWPGLVPFTEDIQAYFHGRDAEAAELLRLIKRELLTVLFGQSGLGKSSLLSAGLFPRLRREDFLPVYIRLEVSPDAPGFSAQVKTLLSQNLLEQGVDARAPRDDETLWEYFHDADLDFWSARNRLLTPVLVLDQFEEIFTLGRHSDEMRARCRAFITELGDLIENRTPAAVERRLEENPDLAARLDFGKRNCKVLLAFREDFLPDFEGLRRVIRSIMQNRMRLTRMNGAQALEAITQSGGHLIASGVAGRIIGFVAGPRGGPGTGEGEEPGEHTSTYQEIEPALLSLVCRELNNKRIAAGRAQITGDLLEAGAQQEIISNFYERSLADLDLGMRVFVEDQLLTEAGYRDSYALDDARHLPGVTQEAIDTLVARRLLRLDERFGVLRIELTHDVLTRVVRDSRDQRQAREAEARRAELDRDRRRRTRRFAGIGVAAGVAVLGVAVVMAVLMQRAVVEKKRVVETQSNVLVTQANISLENRTPRDPQAYLAKALHLNPNNEAAAARVMTLVQQRRYPVHMGERPLPDQLARAELHWVDGQRVVLGDRIVLADDPYRVWRLSPGPDTDEHLRVRRVAALSMGFGARDKLSGVLRFDAQAQRFVRTEAGSVASYLPSSMTRVSAFATVGAGAIRTLSRDARLMAVQDKALAIEITNANVPSPIRIVLPEASRVLLSALEFAPDTASLLAWFSDGNATLFDVATGAPRWTQKIARGAAVAERGAFSPGGRWIISAAGPTVRLHDAKSGAPHGKALMHVAPVNSVSFSHDGEHLLTACQDQAARVWHAESTSIVAPPLMHDGPVVSARFSADKLYVLTASLDGTARIFSAAGEPVVEPMLHDAAVVAAEFSPDGTRVASVSDDGRLHFWQPGHTQRTNHNKHTQMAFDHGAAVTALAASADGTRFATGTARGEVRVWKVNASAGNGAAPVTQERQFAAHAEAVIGLAFNAAGTQLATASGDKTARVWDAATGAAAGKPLRHNGALRSVRFSGDSAWLLTTADDHSARLWSVRDSAPRGLAMRHGAPVVEAELSRDGRIVATAAGTEVRIWDAPTGALLTRLLHAAEVTSLSVSADSSEVIAASGQQIALWKLERGNRASRERRTPDASRAARNLVWVVRHSRDGARFASGGLDGFVQVWAREGLLPVGAPMKHNTQVTRIEFSGDGRWLTTSARDRAVRVWDTRSGQLIADPLRHDYTVNGIAPLAEHAWLATAAADGNLRLWRLGLGFSGAPPDWVVPMVEALGGARIDDSGALVLMDRRAERLKSLEAKIRNGQSDAYWRNWADEALSAFKRTASAAPRGEGK